MYQRLVQPRKAVLAYEKAAEILLRSDEEIDRPELLSLVHMHHAQCLLLESLGEASDKELEAEELEDILSKLKESVLSDSRALFQLCLFFWPWHLTTWIALQILVLLICRMEMWMLPLNVCKS